MINTTIRSIVVAVASGALARLYACPKSIAASHANRKQPAAIEDEIRAYEVERTRIIGNAQTLADDKRAAAVESDLSVLLAQPVELPGVPLALADLLGGTLTETDWQALADFLSPNEA